MSIEDGHLAKLPKVKNFYVWDFTNISLFSLTYVSMGLTNQP